MKTKWITKKLLNKNVAFVVVAVGAYFFWPESLVQRKSRPLPRAEKSRLIYACDFDSNVFTDPSSGWSRMYTNNPKLVFVKAGVLTIEFSEPKTYGAVLTLNNYDRRRIYEVCLRVRQLKTSGALIIRTRKKGRKDLHQIAGVRLAPNENESFRDVSLEFVAPAEQGKEILIQLYQYDRKKDLGGTLIAEKVEVHQW